MSLYQVLGSPLARLVDPERAHRLGVRALRAGLVPAGPPVRDPRLAVQLLGLEFPNPLGMAAGFDKNAEVPDALLKLGFGFTEVGTMTPRPQDGNPRPRVFRLVEDRAVINRLGFNNAGHEAGLARLAARAGRGGIVGDNVERRRRARNGKAAIRIRANAAREHYGGFGSWYRYSRVMPRCRYRGAGGEYQDGCKRSRCDATGTVKMNHENCLA